MLRRWLVAAAAAVTAGTLLALVLTVNDVDIDRPAWTKPRPEPIPDQTTAYRKPGKGWVLPKLCRDQMRE